MAHHRKHDGYAAQRRHGLTLAALLAAAGCGQPSADDADEAFEIRSVTVRELVPEQPSSPTGETQAAPAPDALPNSLAEALGDGETTTGTPSANCAAPMPELSYVLADGPDTGRFVVRWDPGSAAGGLSVWLGDEQGEAFEAGWSRRAAGEYMSDKRLQQLELPVDSDGSFVVQVGLYVGCGDSISFAHAVRQVTLPDPVHACATKDARGGEHAGSFEACAARWLDDAP